MTAPVLPGAPGARYTPDVSTTAAPPARRPRVDAVDLLRGLVMVVMVLDHTRDFNHISGFALDPTDMNRTWPALFFTRWVTHFCAPIFVFLAGTGAWMQRSRGKSDQELSRFLVTRGLWLMLLELTYVRTTSFWTLDYSTFFGFFQVIWAVGLSMVVLGALIRLRVPVRVMLAAGLAIIALHNLLDPIQVPPWRGPGTPLPSAPQMLWMMLHQPGVMAPLGSHAGLALMLYPVLPWIGVMLTGYGFGQVYDWDPARRRRFLWRAGWAAVAGFVVIRAINIYGDPSHWQVQKTPIFTVLSFLNTTKYGPSLLYLLMTLGPALLFLAAAEGRMRAPEERNAVTKGLITFGRVPMFFYMLQWPVSHGIALLLAMAAGQDIARFFQGPFQIQWKDGMGFSLPVVYACWAAGIAILYPLCRWFAGVKARRRDWWLGYL